MLGQYQEAALEAAQVGEELVEHLDLVGLAVEELQEQGLRAGGALEAAEAQLVHERLQRAQVAQQVLNPERRAFAHSGQLRALHVRVPAPAQCTAELQSSVQLLIHHVPELVLGHLTVLDSFCLYSLMIELSLMNSQ